MSADRAVRATPGGVALVRGHHRSQGLAHHVEWERFGGRARRRSTETAAGQEGFGGRATAVGRGRGQGRTMRSVRGRALGMVLHDVMARRREPEIPVGEALGLDRGMLAGRRILGVVRRR
jgi:hypothetical protein